jgi:hypothetical protein
MQMWKATNASHIRTASATAARDGRSEYKSRDPAIVFPMAESAQKDFAISFSDGSSIRNGHGISLLRTLAESNAQI